MAAPMVAAAPIMALTGFGSTGPIAGRLLTLFFLLFLYIKNEFRNANSFVGTNKGSLAAGAQAVAGNVVAGGLFATVQSAAMGGAGVAAVSSALQGVGVAMISTAGSALALNKSKS